MIDGAIDQYAIENNKFGGAPVAWTDIKNYLKTGSVLSSSGGRDMLGNVINGGNFSVDSLPKVPTASDQKLSDVAPSDFWSPYF